MSELVPLVVGGALTLVGGAGTEWLRDRRSSSHATSERKESRQERRDDLERETLIELQDSLQALFEESQKSVFLTRKPSANMDKNFKFQAASTTNFMVLRF